MKAALNAWGRRHLTEPHAAASLVRDIVCHTKDPELRKLVDPNDLYGAGFDS